MLKAVPLMNIEESMSKNVLLASIPSKVKVILGAGVILNIKLSE